MQGRQALPWPKVQRETTVGSRGSYAQHDRYDAGCPPLCQDPHTQDRRKGRVALTSSPRRCIMSTQRCENWP